MAEPQPRPELPPSLSLRLSDTLFLRVEHGIYVALGGILALTALIALGTAAWELTRVALDRRAALPLLLIVDRLLFVMMLAEILHTVRVSIRSGTLTSEPFLIVGLIASIRRVLVITMESSQVTGAAMQVTGPGVFQNSMIELGVLGMLILVLVVSIFLIRRSAPARAG